MLTFKTITLSLLGGVVPALVWLGFWLHEDSKRPEPKGKLAETFLFGMLAVVLVLPFQKWVAAHFPGLGIITFALWALLEESFKFAAGWFGGIRAVCDDEPVDGLVYMITAALGFVALENALFIANPLLAHDLVGGFVTGSLRFVGANLLHVVASAAIGAGFAFSFYATRAKRAAAVIVGFLAAVLFHTAFNLALVGQGDTSPFMVFGAVWAAAGLLLWTFERVKAIPAPRVPPQNKE